MFDHVAIRVSDREASEHFYETVLSTLGFDKTSSGASLASWDEFLVVAAGGDGPVTRRLHIGFAAPSQAHADEFWRAGTEAGHRDDGSPGPRPKYGEDYYGAFVLDPDGNSTEGANHDNLRRDGVVDHLWIRVADLARSKAFYEAVAPHAGFRLKTDTPGRAQFSGRSGSFSVLPGEATENLHMAFPAGDNSTVDAFHAALTAAGFEDNGGPGERPRYHAGYYAAFVLDPDGNNIELVNHNRG
jgi:catechol 2,3-dioxygenase-like lactoylglutathione lyase family enzyme